MTGQGYGLRGSACEGKSEGGCPPETEDVCRFAVVGPSGDRHLPGLHRPTVGAEVYADRALVLDRRWCENVALAIYTPSPAVKKEKIRYAGSKQPRGHPPAIGKTLLNRKPIVRLVKPRTPPPVRIAPRRPPTLGQLFPLLSDQQIRSRAQQEVQSWYGPQRTEISSIAAQQRADAAARRDAYAQALGAAATANMGMAPLINQGFQSAASTLGGLAAGATGQVGAAMRADIAAQNQALQTMGQAQITSDPAQQQGVENYMSGYLPATNLAEMGAFAQRGFLGEVADERKRSVTMPWGEYNSVIEDLNVQERQELLDLAKQRPDYAEKVLSRLYDQRKDAYGVRADIDSRNQKSKAARSEINYKYFVAKQKAKTADDKIALDRWYKNQKTKLDTYDSQTKRMGATSLAGYRDVMGQASTSRAATSAQNAQTSAAKVALAATGYKPLPQIMREVGSQTTFEVNENRKIPEKKAQLVATLFAKYAASVPPNQRPALRKAIEQWVRNLRVVVKHSGSGSAPSGYKPSFATPGAFSETP